MKRVSIILISLTFCFNYSFGQSKTDSITIVKTNRAYQFYKGEIRLTKNQLYDVMQPNDQAYRKINSAQANNAFSSIIGGVGGFMIGWPIGTAIGGGDPNWNLAGVGLAAILVSVRLGNESVKQAKNAVSIYNNGLQTSSFWDRNELRLSLTQNGIGIALSF